MTCQDARARLLESLTGTTPPEVRRAVAAHLAACPACRAEATALEQTVALLRGSADPRLREDYWADFMAGLDRRLLADRQRPWPRFLRRLRAPRHAWTAAAATVAVAAMLLVALLGRPSPPAAVAPPPDLIPRGYVGETVRRAMPAMGGSLAVWKAGFNAYEVPYDAPGGE